MNDCLFLLPNTFRLFIRLYLSFLTKLVPQILSDFLATSQV